MSRPLIQIDDDGNAREMTEEEHAYYLKLWAELSNNAPLPITDSPSS